MNDTERNLIFRLYVPAGKMWSSEADRFLQLFREYLTRVDRLAVRLDQRRADYGVVYEFHGELTHTPAELSQEFQAFSHFMDVCAKDVAAATKLLSAKTLNASELTNIVTRYAKEVRRPYLDLKHEAESKTMAIRHRLETELSELAPTPEDWQVVSTVVAAAIPQSHHLPTSPSNHRYLHQRRMSPSTYGHRSSRPSIM